MTPLKQNKDNDHRVIVTGMGIVTPRTSNLKGYYEDLMAGRSVISQWCDQWRDENNLSHSRVGGDLSHFDVQSYFKSDHGYSQEHTQLALKLLRPTPLPGQLACVSSLQAYYDAGFRGSPSQPERFGCVLGGHNFNNHYGYKNLVTHQESEPDYIEPLFGLIFLDTDILSLNTELLHLLGPGLCIGNSFTSSNTAMLAGANLIKSRRADTVLVICVSQETNFGLLNDHAEKGLVTTNSFNDQPQLASRPFDAKREGLVPSQGAAAFILERMSTAQKRGARPYAEILGGSLTMASAQSFYPTIADEVKTMQAALSKAQISVDEVDYINANADSTQVGDAIEVAAIKELFGNRAYDIPINATKSMLGHCFVASGGIECVATILQMQGNAIHPTINQEQKDPALDLNFVPNQGIDHNIRVALSNSFGYGGLASSIVFGKV